MNTNHLLRLAYVAMLSPAIVLEPRATVVTAHWTNSVSGSWTNAANWDVGVVPNNYGQIVFDVVWDANPVTIELPTDRVMIRNFTFGTPGTLTHTGSGLGDVWIDGKLDWSSGVLAGAVNISVVGGANLHASAPGYLTLEDATLGLNGPTSMSSVLRMQKSQNATRGAQLALYNLCVFDALEGAGIEQATSAPMMRVFNMGLFRIASSTAPFHCAVGFYNEGSLQAGARTLVFDQGLDQTLSGTLLELNGTTIDTPTNSIGVRIETGRLQGQGQINIGTFAGGWPDNPAILSGRIGFGSLTLAQGSRVEVRLGGRSNESYDHFTVSKKIAMGGQLGVGFTNGFDQSVVASDTFEIFALTPGCSSSGSFENVAFENRMDTMDASGSFLVHLTNSAAGGSVLLRDFAPKPVGEGLSPALWYALGTWWNQTPEGLRFWNLFWQHWAEALAMVRTNAALAKETSSLLLTLQPVISAFLSGQDYPVPATQTLIDQLNSTCNDFTNYASPDFRNALEEVRARFGGFQPLLGLTISQAAAQLQFPVPEKPWVSLFRPAVTNGQFQAEANLVTAMNISLWRTPDLMNHNWQVVLGAQIQTNNYSLWLSDTNPSSPMFYRLRAEP